MNTLLHSGKYSDLRIVCDDESWNVHRNIISTASSIFEEMIDELPMKTALRVIDLSEYQPKIVEKMLCFIYQCDYNDEHETEHSGSKLQTSARKALCLDFTASQSQISNRPRTKGEALLINIRVFSIAKKFGLDDLMSLAVEKHREAVKSLWNTPNFERSITLLYDKELGEVHSSELRYATVDIILSNIRELLKKQTFRLLLICHGDLATEVLLICHGDLATEVLLMTTKGS